MSQRCLISYEKNVTEVDSFYDCIYDENSNYQDLLDDWLQYCPITQIYLGPWKLFIRDKELFNNFKKDFEEIKKYCPFLSSLEDIWMIWIDGVLVYSQ